MYQDGNNEVEATARREGGGHVFVRHVRGRAGPWCQIYFRPSTYAPFCNTVPKTIGIG